MRTTAGIISGFFLIIILTDCGSEKSSENGSTVSLDTIAVDSTIVIDYEAAAKQLAQEVIIVDGHVDIAYRLRQYPENITQPTYFGNFDVPKARKGGLNAPFVSIYVPVAYENKGAKRYAFREIMKIKEIVRQHPDMLGLATQPDDIIRHFNQGVISFPLGIENGAPIEGDLQNIAYFHDLGVRYITLCHSKNNHICDASYDKTRKWGGLSPFGKTLIPEMNRMGMMIDISHVSDSAAFQTIRLSELPVIASHSSCRHFTPGMERNASDELIQAIASKGGMVMVNFGSYFLKPSYQQAFYQINAWRRDRGLKMYDIAILNYARQWAEVHQEDPFGTVGDVADHIDHIVDLVGIRHVGLGSDYDGIGWLLPKCLRDVSGYPCLIETLLRRGYTKEEIEQICYRNIFRIWRQHDEYRKDNYCSVNQSLSGF